jgi:membrane associated rhomboid family serine protease
VLRIIAAAAPHSWYPRPYAEQTGFPLDVLLYLLEHLWLDGLLQKGETTQAGAGLRLSPAGEEVLRDPEALRRLSTGEPLRPGDRGCIVRSVFRTQRRTGLTRLLLWMNVLWFGWGFYLAQSRHQAGRAFLETFEHANAQAAKAQQDVLRETGAVEPADLIHGKWWRLLTCCFVHIGLIHLGCNMYGVYAIGRGAEQMWGRVRYLAIYLLSGFCGSCVAMAYSPGLMQGEPPQFIPTLLAGASGALCGILGAEFVWLLLNGRFLPRRAVRRWWWGMAINLVLLTAFSMMANVSALAHFGGVAAGAAAAVMLNVQRFGPPGFRWLALVLLAALPYSGYLLIQRQRAVSDNWALAEKKVYARDYDARREAGDDAYKNAMQPHADLTAERRLDLVLHARRLFEALERDLARTGQYRSPDVIKDQAEVLEEVRRGLKQLKAREEALQPLAEKEEKRNAEAEKARTKREAVAGEEEKSFDKTFRKRISATAAAAEKQMNPDPPDAAALEVARTALIRLADDLKAAGEYRSKEVERQRQLGLDYVVALQRLLDAKDPARRKELTTTWEIWRSKWLDEVEKR